VNISLVVRMMAARYNMRRSTREQEQDTANGNFAIFPSEREEGQGYI
jgi:hypothetical protein